jgi:hypothetical protein
MHFLKKTQFANKIFLALNNLYEQIDKWAWGSISMFDREAELKYWK